MADRGNINRIQVHTWIPPEPEPRTTQTPNAPENTDASNPTVNESTTLIEQSIKEEAVILKAISDTIIHEMDKDNSCATDAYKEKQTYDKEQVDSSQEQAASVRPPSSLVPAEISEHPDAGAIRRQVRCLATCHTYARSHSHLLLG